MKFKILFQLPEEKRLGFDFCC